MNITKIYLVHNEKDYKFLMKELEDRGYLWQTDEEDRSPTTKSFNPAWTWGFPILVHLYDNKTITYEPTEEEDQGLPEEYQNMMKEYNHESI